MSRPLIYFITGANRGIGLALVNEIATRNSEAIIYAGAREPSRAMALQDAETKFLGRVHIVNYNAGDSIMNASLEQLLQKKHGRVDVVIAAAAISPITAHAAETPVDDLRKMFEINVLGVLSLFQALFPILKASSVAKFIPITSSGGSLTYGIEADFGLAGYGSSKAALNYICRKIHFENDWITCFPLAPGIVATDMLADYCKRDSTGEMERLAQRIQTPPSVTATQLTDVIEKSARSTHGGEFLNFDGTMLTW